MSTIQTPYREGGAFGFRYIFEAAGDGLPEHAHSPELEHGVEVERGRVAVISAAGTQVLAAHECATFDSSEMHRIIALEPAQIVNRIAAGIPAAYRAMSDDELSGRLDVPIDFLLA